MKKRKIKIVGWVYKNIFKNKYRRIDFNRFDGKAPFFELVKHIKITKAENVNCVKVKLTIQEIS